MLTDVTFLSNRASASRGGAGGTGGAVNATRGGQGGDGGNGGDGQGGALYLAGGTVTINRGTMTANRAVGRQGGSGGDGGVGSGTGGNGGTAGSGGDGQGGGVYIAGTGTNLSILYTGLEANRAFGGFGGTGGDGGNVTGTTLNVRGGYAGPAGPGGNAQGGGIYVQAGTAVVTITSSTLASNVASAGPGRRGGNGGNVTAAIAPNGLGGDATNGGAGGNGQGGGLFVAGSTVNLVNSTVSGNFARPGNGGNAGVGGGASTSMRRGADGSPGAKGTSQGGGVYLAGGVLNVSNSTVANNQANNEGGGILLQAGALNLVSTIVADNISTTSTQIDISVAGGTITATTTLVGDSTGSTLTAAGGNLLDVDPLLGPLVFNGGPTRTQLLQAGSPAIGTGSNPLGLVFDQRGAPFARSPGGVTDIGAVSSQAAVGDLVGVFRGSSGTVFLNLVNGPYNPLTTLQFQFGANGDISVVGDWDGDGVTEVGVFRPSTGTWFLSPDNGSYNPLTAVQFFYGAAGDVPVVGDWDDDGDDDIGIFRPSSGTWFLNTEDFVPGTSSSYNSATTIQVSYGANGDVPVVGSWDGDGQTHIGVFRSGTWFLDFEDRLAGTSTSFNTATTAQVAYGAAGDTPVVGKWVGGTFDHIGVFRGSSGTWFLDTEDRLPNTTTSFNAATSFQIQFGSNGDIPVPGDWLADGVDRVGVFRPSNGNWFLDTDTTRVVGVPSGFTTAFNFQFGVNGDQPEAGRWDGPLPQLLDGAEGSGGAAISSDIINAVVAAAIKRWQASGISDTQLAQLTALHFGVADLPTGWLGESLGSGEVLLDSTGGGHGWFVDGTPDQDEEFVGGAATGAAAGKVDL
ncbi:MAG: hypothetical protein K2R98_09940, partial [Gemmataceae bacterium]|nr:hypothetical protein [Gemmataceae bacterium]